MADFDLTFFQKQIETYQKNVALYTQFCDILKKMLEYLAGEVSAEHIVQARVKTLMNVADKITLGMPKERYSIEKMADICTLQIILPNLEDLKTVAGLIQANFLILSNEIQDYNTVDHFGMEYTPLSFIIQLPKESELYERLNISLLTELKELKAEIRVSTILQHAQLLNFFDDNIKRDFKIPTPYNRILNQIAALLETTDKFLTELHRKLQDYASSYGSYMSHKEIISEMERLEILFAADKKNFPIAHKYAKLAMIAENWEKARNILEAILENSNIKRTSSIQYATILRDLGIVLCKIYDPSASGFMKGQSFLKEAINLTPQDSDAHAALGGTFKIQLKEEEAFRCYKRALEVNPGDPYPLGNFLIYEIKRNGNLNPVKYYEGMIKTAIKRRQNQIEVYIDLPWAFFDIGIFYLLRGDFYTSFTNYLLALRFSPQIWMIETSLKTLDNLEPVWDQIEGIDLIRQLLLLGITFHPNRTQLSNEYVTEKILPKLQISLKQNLKLKRKNLIIIAGASESIFEGNVKIFKEAFIQGFRDFQGTIISGGTILGVGKLVGDITETYGKRVRAVGYVPDLDSSKMTLDNRYTEIRKTTGGDFSILEALQYWFDILQSGIDPTSVKMLVVDGGRISALECRMAIVFGAQVGILQESTRTASDLLNDPLWQEYSMKAVSDSPMHKFKSLSNDSSSIHDFLTKPFIIDKDIENLQRVLIRESSGKDIFEINFIESVVECDYIAGLTAALDMMGAELNIGQMLATKFNNGYLLGGFILGLEFKIIFFLKTTPSRTLEEKIEAFIKRVEQDLKDDLLFAQKRCLVYKYSPKIERIFVDIFGNEFLKLVSDLPGT